MKINPSNKELYTDSGAFLKRLHCPISVMWKDMSENGSNTRMCSQQLLSCLQQGRDQALNTPKDSLLKFNANLVLHLEDLIVSVVQCL